MTEEVDIFEHVLHALNGHGALTQHGTVKWTGLCCIMELRQTTWGLDGWIERAYRHRRITAMECLALIYCALAAFEPDETKKRKIVYGWAEKLAEAAVWEQFLVRDSATNLPLDHPPMDWDWMLWLDEADRFVLWRGMNWKCSDVVAHLYKNRAAPVQERKPFSPDLVAHATNAVPDDRDSQLPTNSGDGTSARWEDAVRTIGDELDLRDAKSGAYCSNKEMADRIAKIALERGIKGPNGQLTGANILRFALQGGRWERRRNSSNGQLMQPENPENPEYPENSI